MCNIRLGIIMIGIIGLSFTNVLKGQDSNKTRHFRVHKIAEGVYACTHEFGGEAICNAGVIDLGNYSVVIDPFLSPSAAEELKKWIENNQLGPVRYVINTHYHNDHVRGNQVFEDNVQVIATSKTAELIKDQEPKLIAAESQYAPPLCQQFSNLKHGFKGDTMSRQYKVYKMMHPYFCALARSKNEVITRIPDLLFEGKMMLQGSRRIELWDMGAGHTPSDVVVYLPDDKILFGSDLVTNDFHPYLPDGDPSNWLRILSRLDQLELETVIPGHGAVSNKTIVKLTSDYIHDIISVASTTTPDSDKKDPMGQPGIPDKYKDWWLDQFYAQNVSFLQKKNGITEIK